jgi:hypothetical protein
MPPNIDPTVVMLEILGLVSVPVVLVFAVYFFTGGYEGKKGDNKF